MSSERMQLQCRQFTGLFIFVQSASAPVCSGVVILLSDQIVPKAPKLADFIPFSEWDGEAFSPNFPHPWTHCAVSFAVCC